MKNRWRCIAAFLLVFVFATGLAYGQHSFKLQTYNINIEVLPESIFQDSFGNNREIPRNHAAIIALAKKLYPPLGLKKTVLPLDEGFQKETMEDAVEYDSGERREAVADNSGEYGNGEVQTGAVEDSIEYDNVEYDNGEAQTETSEDQDEYAQGEFPFGTDGDSGKFAFGEHSDGDVDDCGEYQNGLLFSALQNPAISDRTRLMVDKIIAAAIPPLPKNKVSKSGHFKIFYTSNNADPLHNVTDQEIINLAALLDAWWTKYATNFKKPKFYLVGGVERIDVKVYYINATMLGKTGSGWNHIELNSALCVKNACKRQTTSAHELFHRVQYNYSYISGTASMSWLVEGTAVWSQGYTNLLIRDYMGWMNQGLAAPDLNLITGRSYNAAHFWQFLQERDTWAAIKSVWATYQTNGKNAKAAVNTVTTAELGLNFDAYVQKWHKANYIKDLINAATGGYNYVENAVTQTSCGVTYGPLSKVPATVRTVKSDTSWTLTGTVKPYGADYWVLKLDPALTKLSVQVKGADTGNFSYHFIGVKGNSWKSIINSTANKYSYTKTLTAGQWDSLVVVVTGRSLGGTYDISVGGCIAGTWVDSYSKTWVLMESGTSITGTRDSTSVGCGVIPVTGTYTSPNITLYTPAIVSGCCSVTWTGTATDCKTIRGTWTQTGGAIGCTISGSFSMTKHSGNATASVSRTEKAGDPTCCNCNP